MSGATVLDDLSADQLQGRAGGQILIYESAMTKEMETWKAESRRHDESLDSEGKATEESLQALQARLAEVDDQIQEQLQKITSVKANISRNDSRINQLLRMVVSV